MLNENWFEEWFNSPYYQVLYENRDHDEAEDFTDALVDYLHPAAGSRILDIACGEGRFSLQFAEKGYDVTGIDLADNSIAKANEHAGEQLRFFVHDMRFPFYINYFDYAFNLFTSFGYFAHNRDNALAARSFAGGLKKGGTLVIDYLNKEYVLANLVPKEDILRGGITFHIKRYSDSRHIIKEIRFTDDAGKEQMFTERVSAFGLEDFRKLFAAAGMRLVDQFGDYALHPFDPASSQRLIMVFKKEG